jgi:hypothetical protein
MAFLIALCFPLSFLSFSHFDFIYFCFFHIFHLPLTLTSKQCRGQENVDLYIHSPIRLHGIVLSTGSNFTFYFSSSNISLSYFACFSSLFFPLLFLFSVSYNLPFPEYTTWNSASRQSKFNVYHVIFYSPFLFWLRFARADKGGCRKDGSINHCFDVLLMSYWVASLLLLNYVW